MKTSFPKRGLEYSFTASLAPHRLGFFPDGGRRDCGSTSPCGIIPQDFESCDLPLSFSLLIISILIFAGLTLPALYHTIPLIFMFCDFTNTPGHSDLLPFQAVP